MGQSSGEISFACTAGGGGGGGGCIIGQIRSWAGRSWSRHKAKQR